MESDIFYLDACSTTPIHSEVIDKVYYINKDVYGNPSSIHLKGIQSSEILESSRLSISKKLNCSYKDIIFTSGSTESINLAIKGISSNMKPGRIVISSVEHSAVLNSAKSLVNKGWSIEKWPVDNLGNIRLDMLEKLLSPPTKFVSLIWAQSEVGSVQPIHLIASECKRKNIIFHTDATQLIPHSLIDFNNSDIDLLSASAHKFQGPKGIGLLLIKSNTREILQPIITGGPQESGYRSGTEPIALIAGMDVALGLISHKMKVNKQLTTFVNSQELEITKKLFDSLSTIKGIKFIGNSLEVNRIPNHISILLSNKKGEPLPSRRVVRNLSDKGIYVSSGSACNSGLSQDNKTLKAMNYEKKWLQSCLRISTGNWININSIDRIAEIFEEVLSIY